MYNNSPVYTQVGLDYDIDEEHPENDQVAAVPQRILIQSSLDLSPDGELSRIWIGLHQGQYDPANMGQVRWM